MSELTDDITSRLLKFITCTSLHVDAFWMTLKKHELIEYINESKRLGDIDTVYKLEIILKNKTEKR